MSLHLNPFAVSGLLITAAYFPLWILILIKGKSKAAYIYGLHILCALIWGIGSFYIGINTSEENAVIAWKLIYPAVIFIPIFFEHSTLIIFNKKAPLFLKIIYIQAIYFTLMTLLGKVFIEPRLIFNSIYFNHVTINYHLSFAIWMIIVTMTYLRLFKQYRKSHPEQKKQIFFLMFAFTGFLGGATNFIPNIIPEFYPYGNFLVPIHSVFITYAILRYKLLEIEIVVKKGMLYSITITIISVFYLLSVLLLEKLIQGFLGYHSIFASITIAFFLGLLFIPLRNKIQNILDKFLFEGTQIELSRQNELLRHQIGRTEKLKTIATLASGMAHEIKNPLTAIKTFSEYLPQKLNDKSFLLQFSQIVGKEVERIDKLVQELLEFAKPDPLKKRKTDIVELIDDTLSFLNSQFIKQKIEIHFEKHSTPILLEADNNKLRQALLNILLNAIEAMPNGGILTVQTRFIGNPLLETSDYSVKNESFIEVTIEDTGCGISKEDLPHIFDPFYSKKDGGTGLGLSITHGIIKEHGGTIRVESEAGKGARFIIELPVQSKNAEGSIES